MELNPPHIPSQHWLAFVESYHWDVGPFHQNFPRRIFFKIQNIKIQHMYNSSAVKLSQKGYFENRIVTSDDFDKWRKDRQIKI